MKVIVGLGNPGPQYERNRHNVGYRLVTDLATAAGLPFARRRFRAQMAAGRIADQDVLLVKPMTFMNASGQAVGSLVHFYKLELTDLLVAYDDLDLPLGKIRLRAGGSSGGHKGMHSIIDCLGTEAFARLRIGIGRPPQGDPIAYVLENFSSDEEAVVNQVLERAKKAVYVWLSEGIEAAMNCFNRASDCEG